MDLAINIPDETKGAAPLALLSAMISLGYTKREGLIVVGEG